ncbi:hypothetical protein QBC43DRAFT_366893 [Cladorrhinum sp. PSN259]|nr:hypothetical protein QBC43DRAFT_366893 [Cladorrhinum sp. PSN259]
MNESTTNLGALFQRCLADFRDLLQDFHNNHDKDSLLLSQSVNGYGRLRIWGYDFRADLPDRSRHSLGAKLRLDYKLRGSVVHALELLSQQILDARNALSNLTDPTTISINAAGDEDSDTESSEGGDHLSRALEILLDQIQLLYHLGILIRRQASSPRYLKSNTSTSNSTKGTIISVLPEDVSHIRETIRRWRGAEAQSKPPEEEKAVSLEYLLQRNEAGSQLADETDYGVRLINRLALANATRREQFSYWREDPDQPVSARPTYSAPIISSREDNQVQGTESVKSGGSSRFTQDMVARSDILGRSSIHETNLDFYAIRTTYPETVVGTARTARVPSVPKEAESSLKFECPYCHLELDSSEMQDRMKWKRHVFRDLRPYTCTDLDCPSGAKLYSSRSDWIYHQMQIHRRRWVCELEGCQEVKISPADMSTHLSSIHRLNGPTKDLLLSIYERPMEDSVPATCPLCPMKSTLKSMLSHLAKHMEDLSLFALPKLDGNVESDQERLSQELEDSPFQRASTRLPKEVHERIAALPAEITSVLHRIADLSYTELEAENLKPSMAEIQELLERTLANLKEAERKSLKLLLGDHDKKFDDLISDALHLCLQLHELLAAAFGSTRTTFAASMHPDRNSILAQMKLADHGFKNQLREKCNELMGVIAGHSIAQGMPDLKVSDLITTLPSASPDSGTPLKKYDHRHESTQATALKTQRWRCDRCLELNQDSLNNQCTKCSHRYCKQCTDEEHETWDHNYEQKRDDAHHLARPESSVKTSTVTKNKATPVSTSQTHREHGKFSATTTSWRAKSLEKYKLRLWYCHRCNQDNNWDITSQCISPSCQHNYCDRCTYEEHEVRGYDRQQVGSV